MYSVVFFKKKSIKKPEDKLPVLKSREIGYGYYQPPSIGTTARSTPAATADPITPETFGPIACMSR